MHTFNTPTTVNRQEAEALKEMIFNRARARAEALNKETQNSYVDNVQTELMDLARTSFISNRNPFSSTKPLSTVEIPAKEVEEEVTLTQTTSNNTEGLGFETPKSKYINSQIKLKTDISNEELTKSAVMATMDEASKSLQSKSTFMGALNFLNSQASIAIVNKTGKRFEANA